MNNTSVAVFFMVKEKKLARNGTFDNKILKEIVSGSE